MKITNIHEAKTHFSKLMERAAAGEEIVIGKAGKPLARLGPYAPPAPTKRKPGGWKGKVWISPDFDKFDVEVEKLFYGAPIQTPARYPRAAVVAGGQPETSKGRTRKN